MNKVNAMTIAALAAALCAAPSLAGESPAAIVAKNRALVAKFADSVATVRYYTKRDADGKEPEIKIPYKCPNCGGTHFERGNVSAEKGIPAEFAGFVIGQDRILMQDVMLPPEYIERIEVVCGGEAVGAEEFEWSPAHDAIVLKTATPLAKAKPLAFAAGAAQTGGEGEGMDSAGPRYFFIVREDGETVAGVAESKATEFRHHVEVGKDIYKGTPNTIVLGENDEPVTIALQRWIELGKEVFDPPAKWEWKPAAARFDAIKALETRLAKAILPAYVQLEAKKKDEGRYSRWSDDTQDDMDAVCVLLEKDVAIVPIAMKPDATARLAKMDATLPDGKKVPLEFVGSYDKFGAIAVKFAGGTPQGLEPLALDRRDPLTLFGERQFAVEVSNRGGSLKFRTGAVEVLDYTRVEGNETIAKQTPLYAWDGDDDDNAFCLCVAASGAVAALELDARKESRYRRYDSGAAGSSLLAMVDAPVYDPENIPRKADDRKRTAWLGVETQPAGAEIVREKKATAFIGRYVDRAPLVTGVASNSPAAKAGILEGDILISARYPGNSREEKLAMESDYGSMIDWGELFDHEGLIEMAGERLPTPWENVEKGVNSTLTEFGVGTEVIVAWVRDGRRMEAKLKLELAPVHFQNAPRSRSKTLGVTVADMTYEVRKYFKFDDAASGVVIDKVKGGGPAAVAGLKPLELILQVNGEDVKDAKDFLAKTKDKKDLTFSVRRLTATRVVPIKLQ
jgi:hypothetical protein